MLHANELDLISEGPGAHKEDSGRWMVFDQDKREPQRSKTSRTKKMKRFLIVIEKASTGYSAYSPDVPGCIATASTRKSVENRIRQAIQFHIEGLREEGYELPKPKSKSSYVDVPA
jgi:predicted RNase H-like HicB family nuclease